MRYIKKLETNNNKAYLRPAFDFVTVNQTIRDMKVYIMLYLFLSILYIQVRSF